VDSCFHGFCACPFGATKIRDMSGNSNTHTF
jgi:hypothetical protein